MIIPCSDFRLNLMLETIRSLPSASAITPTFDHMAVDTSWERKVLKKVTWLQIPGECFLTGGERDFAFGTEKNPLPTPPPPFKSVTKRGPRFQNNVNNVAK